MGKNNQTEIIINQRLILQLTLIFELQNSSIVITCHYS